MEDLGETSCNMRSGDSGDAHRKGNTMADEIQAKAPETGAASGPSGDSRPSGGGGGYQGNRPASAPRPAGGPGGRGKFFRRKKVCKFCTEKIDAIPYRDVRLLQGFVAERGKIVPRRLTGVCTTHQRRLTRAIKQARNIALLAFAARH
jgi:small subunit ribosomal protein S18